jgi:hypothetical protein
MSDLNLTIGDLVAAIGNLTEAIRLLKKCKECIVTGAFFGNKVIGDLANAWYQVNQCRLYTETSVTFEGYTQTAMGQIVDAREMVDSLIHWGKGMTPHARAAILLACGEAIGNVSIVLNELENMLSKQVEKSEFAHTVSVQF